MPEEQAEYETSPTWKENFLVKDKAGNVQKATDSLHEARNFQRWHGGTIFCRPELHPSNGGPIPPDSHTPQTDMSKQEHACKSWNMRASGEMDSEANEILSGRTTTELSIHTGSHPDVVRTALDRLKGSDNCAHDIILALYRDLQIARNRAEYLGNKLLEVLSEDAV